MNSYHSGCCACGKLLKGHGFDTQRSQSLQSKPSSYHATVGKVHSHYTNTAQRSIRKASTHTEKTNRTATVFTRSHGRFPCDLLLLTVDTHWSGQPLCYSDYRTRIEECGIFRLIRLLRLRNQSHERSDSHPTLSQCDSQRTPLEIPSRNRTQMQCDLLPPSSHILRLSIIQLLRVTRTYSSVLCT